MSAPQITELSGKRAFSLISLTGSQASQVGAVQPGPCRHSCAPRRACPHPCVRPVLGLYQPCCPDPLPTWRMRALQTRLRGSHAPCVSGWDLNFGLRGCQACAALSPLSSPCGLLPSSARHRVSPESRGQPGTGEKGCPTLCFRSSHTLSLPGAAHSCLRDRDRGRHQQPEPPFSLS